ncbi:MAG: N-acetylglucosamine-6-phosphate deacetylase [Planctomycetes bacterium]|nr:N-acetylglucosamine-6-phosphate deacetylase [Planctomycetota bacterium]
MSFLDLHIHGAFGVDFLSARSADLERLALLLGERGYGSFLPTLLPVDLDDLEAALERLVPWLAARAPGDGRGAVPLGVHFEGPFLSPLRTGALSPERFLDGKSDRQVARFLALIDTVPGSHMVTLAPEIPGGFEILAEFVLRGFLVSLGHTDAPFATLEAALAAGARHMTHFCNAMRPLHHREPGPIGFGLLQDGVSVDVIADGHHLHAAMLRLILRAKPRGRVALISDATPVAGLGDGDYSVWGQTISVRGGAARNVRGGLAGAAALLQQGVDHLVSLGFPREDALACATTVPHALLNGRS